MEEVEVMVPKDALIITATSLLRVCSESDPATEPLSYLCIPQHSIHYKLASNGFFRELRGRPVRAQSASFGSILC